MATSKMSPTRSRATRPMGVSRDLHGGPDRAQALRPHGGQERDRRQRNGGQNPRRRRRPAQSGLLHRRPHRRARGARPRRGAAARRNVSRGRRRRSLHRGAGIVEELAKVGRAFQGVPQIANIVEGGGQTPVLPPDELYRLGFKMVAYPTTVLFRVARTIETALAELKFGKAIERRRRRGLRGIQGYHRLQGLGTDRRSITTAGSTPAPMQAGAQRRDKIRL